MERKSPNGTFEPFFFLVRVQQTFENVFIYAMLMPEQWDPVKAWDAQMSETKVQIHFGFLFIDQA